MVDSSTLVNFVESMSEETVEVLQSLIRIPSVTGEEEQIGAFVANQCREIGLCVEIVEAEPKRPNVVATWNSGKPGPTLLLNDHLDMFPPGPAEYWSHPPFAAERVAGRVYGRGAIDTKSGLTTMIMATKALRASRFPIHGRLVLIFSCDEEIDSTLGIQHLAKIGLLKADMAIVTEPTTMQVEIATKGRLNVEIVTRGKATHGARPWLGHNAIDDMVHVILELRNLAERIGTRKHPLLGCPSLNVGLINGGTASNLVPDMCRIEVDRRLLPSESREEALTEIRGVLDKVAEEKPDLMATMAELSWRPGYLLDDDEPVIEVLCKAFEKIVGHRPRIAAKDAGTDASLIYTLANIPVVMFSPGNGLEAGTVDESVAVEDLITATKVIAQVLFAILVENV